ncbi:MAG TPA: restriction endonuclease [Bacteroidetes bacterium]|nr:restriction endonuclease [Bacteroidota bacterium]
MSVKHGFLADYFEGFGYKILKPVEIDPKVSHEHEFNGINSFKEILGPERQYLPCRVIYLTDDEDDIVEDRVILTWYDARENHPTRTEYRLYYPESDCFSKAKPDDLLVVCKNIKTTDSALTMFIAKAGDTISNQLSWLFGISAETLTTTGRAEKIDTRKSINYFSNLVLTKVGITLEEPDDSLLDKILERFPGGFPKTVDFSEFSRSFVSDVLPQDNPDAALIEYLDYEEHLFRVFEKSFVEKKLNSGFSDVDDFIRFSLSVQNRRKSRAGYALENHLKFIFDSMEIRYSYNEITENKSRPDFIFPGITEYRDETFPPLNLTMLGVKTTCKDRWRQVLTEAKRISQKHLCTLEPSITEDQTNEMISHQLQLVVPASIVSTYKENQQTWLMTISNFVSLARERQDVD